MSHSAEKCKKALLTYILLQNIKKLERGTHALKNRKGDPLVSSGFVGYVKKVKNERGTLLHYFPLTRLGLMALVVLVVSIVRKVDQSE